MIKHKDLVTFAWLTPMVRRMKKLSEVTSSDVGNPDVDFTPEINGRRILNKWNSALRKAGGKKKP